LISRFCIDRPIFATVLSLVITLAGTLALLVLPVAQYPAVTPPTVQVSCSYPGANAQVVADTVAAPIEQQVNGVEGMLYMSSTSGNDGSYNLTVTFDLGADLNTALVLVQNRVALATPQLPTSVQRQGLSIRKKTPDLLLVVNFISPDGRYDDLYLSNYATINVKDELLRIDGVADINYLGERDYSIRAWLDPQKLAAHNVTVGEVAAAVRDQNTDPAAGQTGAQPGRGAGAFALPLGALGRLTQPRQFDDIVVKVAPGVTGAAGPGVLRLRDLARVELAAQSYSMSCTLDGRPSVGLAIHQLPESNALVVAAAVRRRMEELRTRFPAGLDYRIDYDTSPFVAESLRDLGRTLLQAVALVACVVLLFLQDWRAALIPMAAVPVAILGTFAVMAALGYSLNTISLFGLVLAIGIVVDDAIVVLENVQRWLDQGLPAREAAHRAMAEVTGPIIAVALVLAAVFVPCAFIPGIPGQFFRQFAVTIAVSTALSAVNSLTLSPALAALLLRPKAAPAHAGRRPLAVVLGWPFALVNRCLAMGTAWYTRLIARLLRAPAVGLLVYAGLLALTAWAFTRAPVGFIPPQDQGHCFVTVELPDAASLPRTRAVMAQVEAIARATPGVAHTCTISGTSLVLGVSSANFGTMFVVLAPFDQRRATDLHVDAIMTRLRQAYAQQVTDADVSVLGAPPVPGISLAGGLKLMVEDRAALGPAFLQAQADALADRLRRDPQFAAVTSPFRGSIPQLYLEIDRAKVLALGVALQDVDEALQTYLGASYANSFNEFGRFWQVNLMADGRFRNRVDDIGQLQVRNQQGEMVPLGTLLRVRDSSGPVMIQRYNLYSAAPLTAWMHWEASSQAAIARVDAQALQTLPRTMAVEWTELTFFQVRAGDTAMVGFLLGVVFAFLALAALYESWSLPLAVILVVPLCLLSALAGVLAGRIAVNLFVQIGFVLLVGLACKNAILIVEFARAQRLAGQDATAAILAACRLRLRPILMTSLALILGVLPLVLAEGAGAEMRRSLGLAVFSGMIGVTLFGVFLTPLFFHLLDRHRPPTARPGVGTMALSGAGGLLAGVGVARLAGAPLAHALAAGAALAIALIGLFLARRRHGTAQGSDLP